MIKIFKLESISKKDYVRILGRAQMDLSKVMKKVSRIITSVQRFGDKALINYTRQWDNPDFSIRQLRVTKNDIRQAYERTPKQVIAAIRKQIRLSRQFAKLQKKNICNWEKEVSPGIIVGEKWVPIEEVGLYIPGGKNPFPTVQQILAVAAKTAGCKRIVACISPKGNNYETIIAANECGVNEIYRIGGAQAIAAMAYGTKAIRPVELITGPGNPFVTAAKELCQQKVAIDMPAGPSEAVIIADDKANPIFCAADMLARAEHGPDSAAVLVTTSMKLAQQTQNQLEKQLPMLDRQEYIQESLRRYCAIIVVKNMGEAVKYANEYAPEHLELMVKNPTAIFEQIQNAGSVFLGALNPVALGDYATGINHVLPTMGWAKRSSAVGVWTYMKRVQYSNVNKKGFKELAPIVDAIAPIEGLIAHKKSVNFREEFE